MDYIQKDLELIRMASGEKDASDKDKSVPKKRGRPPKLSQTKLQTTAKNKSKPGRKTLSPKRAESDKDELKDNKKVRRSTGGRPALKKTVVALGKIRLPAVKKVLVSQGLQKVAPRPKSPREVLTPSPLVPTRGAPSKKRKVLDPDAVPIEGICFEEGARIEAVDHGQWYRARIVKVDHEKMDILVHFDGWGSRFDTWFPMTSSLIRGRTERDEKPDAPKYEAGEDVLARWTDGNFYPATILCIKGSGSCQVMYFDGMKKLLRPNFIKKMSEKEKEEAMQAAQKLLIAPPADVGSPVSSDSANASVTNSEFRKYKTSANDRERRIAARSGGATPDTTPKAAGRRKRALKRKAETIEAQLSKSEAGTTTTREGSIQDSPDVTCPKKISSEDDSFNAKKARLDKITSSLVNRVSPVPENDGERTSSAAEDKDTKSCGPIQSVKFFLEPSSPEAAKSHPSSDSEEKSNESSPQSTAGKAKQRLLEKESTMNKRKPTTPTQVQPVKEIDQERSEEIEEPKSPDEEKMNKSGSSSSADSPSVTTDAATSFKVGDIVLAKWADCRSYLAYIIGQESHDQYKIRYYDGMVKVVKASFIHAWVGPLPDSLKSFKGTSMSKQRSRSIDAKSAHTKISTSPTSGTKSMVARRRTISAARKTEVSPPPIRRRRQSDSKEVMSSTTHFAIGEKVIAKWSDLRWYPATVVSKKDGEYYEVRYHDKMTKIVRDTWLNPWSPKLPSKEGGTSLTKVAGESSDNVSKTTTDSPSGGQTTVVEKVHSDEPNSLQTVILPKGRGRKKLTYTPGNSVLARFTDGKNYPATVKESLGGDKYIVEFGNGVRTTIKSSVLKPWNPLALPPVSKYRYNRKSLDVVLPSTNVPSVSETATTLPLAATVLEQASDKEKPSRLWAGQTAKMPRQVVRGYDAYYSGLPKQTMDLDRQLFSCRVPGCTKRFRKEDMLRQHHKVYHQKRYKLRDQKSHPHPVRRRSLKDASIRRRVSADYNTLYQNSGLGPTSVDGNRTKFPQTSQGVETENVACQVADKSVARILPETKGTSKSISLSDTVAESKLQAEEQVTKKKRGRPSRKRSAARETPEVESQPVEKVAMTEEPSPPEPEEEEESLPSGSIEEVIRCSCGSEEEEGVMIQCEGCFTWQHIACIRLNQQQEKSKNNGEKVSKQQSAKEKESVVRPPIDGYICWVCRNPQNVRRSRRYLYNNDFLTKGKLPSLRNFLDSPEKVKPSKDEIDPTLLTSLLDEVTKMQEVLYGIKQKIKLATSVDEDILLKTWEDLGVSGIEKIEDSQPTDGDSKEDGSMVTASCSADAKDSSKGISLQSPQKSKKKSSDGKHPLPQKLSGENHETYILRCRENLLDHVAELETELSNRITRLTDFVTSFQSSSDDEEIQNADELQKDLSVVQALLARC